MAIDIKIPPRTGIDVEVRIPTWNGYPADLPRPNGPFRLVSPESLVAAQRQGFLTFAGLRVSGAPPGLQAFLHPLWLGGLPDPVNTLVVSRSQHAALAIFWSRQAARIAALPDEPHAG